MSVKLVWQVIWPWLFYESLIALNALLFARTIGEMGVLLLSMTAASAVLYPVYFYREGRLLRLKTEAAGVLKRGKAAGAKTEAEANIGEMKKSDRKSGSLYWDVAVTAVSACLCFHLFLFFSGLSSRPGSYEETARVLFSADWQLQLLVMGLAAPLCEEMIFRGLAYRCLKKKTGAVPAAVISAAFFALYHGNFLQGIYAGGLGLLLALACECSFPAAVWFHCCVNLTSIGFNFLLKVFPECTGFRGLLLALFAAGGAGTVLGVYRMQRLRKERNKRSQNNYEKELSKRKTDNRS